VCACVCVNICVCVCVREREKERGIKRVRVSEIEGVGESRICCFFNDYRSAIMLVNVSLRDTECACACVCVSVRERESVCERERDCV
jgi:hypothetical protein